MSVIGTQQSPIKIESSAAHHIPALRNHIKFHYDRDLAGEIIDHNFVFYPPLDPKKTKPWSITVGGVTWLIRQIHMHACAEHLVDSDDAASFEVHLVHSAPDDPGAKGAKLVVGVFAKSGPAKGKGKKPSLHKLAGQLKQRQAAKTKAPEPADVNPQEFLPDDDLKSFYHYEGSLTGPPYSEDVSWFVMKDDTIVDKADFDELEEHARHRARIVQPLNRRMVLKNFK